MRALVSIASTAFLLAACDVVSGLHSLDYDLPTEVDGGSGCQAPMVDCDGVCVELDNSLEHCGACNSPCTFANAEASCAQGQCLMGACSGTFEDCNGEVGDGCEADLAGDPNHCGSCGFVCPVDGSAPHTQAACAQSMCDIVCEDGWGDCDAAVGCETHTDIDAASCGRCGHDCLGGGCAGGRCQPLELATGQQTRVLAVDGPYLYWNARQPAPNGRILRIDTSGAGSIEIVADGLHMPGFFAVDTSNVYIALNAQSCSPNSQPCIGRSLKSPADPTINLFYSTTVIATGLAAAGGWLYYREGTEVKRVASTLQFGASVLASGQATSGSELMVSSDGSTLHWANGDAMPYEVWSAATDGSGATAIGSVADWPVAITQLGDDLYISGVNGSLAVLPRSASGEAASVVTSLAGIFGSLASTANEVVFVVGGQPITWVKPDGAGGFVIEADLVVNVPVDFGAGEVVVTADAAAVYWVDGSTGTIFKLAR